MWKEAFNLQSNRRTCKFLYQNKQKDCTFQYNIVLTAIINQLIKILLIITKLATLCTLP